MRTQKQKFTAVKVRPKHHHIQRKGLSEGWNSQHVFQKTPHTGKFIESNQIQNLGGCYESWKSQSPSQSHFLLSCTERRFSYPYFASMGNWNISTETLHQKSQKQFKISSCVLMLVTIGMIRLHTTLFHPGITLCVFLPHSHQGNISLEVSVVVSTEPKCVLTVNK